MIYRPKTEGEPKASGSRKRLSSAAHADTPSLLSAPPASGVPQLTARRPLPSPDYFESSLRVTVSKLIPIPSAPASFAVHRQVPTA